MTDNRADTAPATDPGTNPPGDRSDTAGDTDRSRDRTDAATAGKQPENTATAEQQPESTATAEQQPESTAAPAPTGGQASRPAGSAGDVPADDTHTRPRYAPPAQERFDWRGWVLVSIVVVSFLLVPGAILLLPYAQSFVEWLGLPLRAAYLGLPMIPAVLLGATAVWAAVRSRSSGE